MTAREMFEKLGYEVLELFGYVCVRYKKKQRPNSEWDYGREINFRRSDKSYTIYGTVTLELNQAITQQMKELGWIE